MIKPEQIGRGTRLRFKNDENVYYAKNVSNMNGIWYVFVVKGDDISRTYRKSIKNISQIDGKTHFSEGISLISVILGKK